MIEEGASCGCCCRAAQPANTRHDNAPGAGFRSQVTCPSADRSCSLDSGCANATWCAYGYCVRWPDATMRTSSRALGVKTMWANPEMMLESSGLESARSNRLLWPALAAKTMPSRPGIIGPLINRLPSCQPSRRSIAGGLLTVRPACSPGGAKKPSTLRVQLAAGRRGVSETASPGALTSTGIRPVWTSTRSHSWTPGMNSGVPLPDGSVTLMSPMRNCVWVQVLPCAPMRAGCPMWRPPVSIWSEMRSAGIVSSSEYRLSLDGRSISAASGMVVTSIGRSRGVSAGSAGEGACAAARGAAQASASSTTVARARIG